MKQKLTPEYIDHPSSEADELYRSSIKLLARAIVQAALADAHRQLRVSKPLPFSTNPSDDLAPTHEAHAATGGRLS